ncbi:hypothetical protein PG985_003352 [Apiospora marii]|uniref:2EXR domain-containing protein n=1 Tax=Apiospora marii TaxID=335849 RepID=A0ABR1RWG7_9PEZI
MATTFHNFVMLPTELRLAIWECSLEEEKAGRHVLVRLEFSQADEQTIMPTRQLTSSLLRVNQEARALFLKAFPVAVDVFKIEVGEHNVWSSCLMVESTQTGEWYLTRQFYYDMPSLREKERHAGLVYLNPKTDIFVLGFGLATGSARNMARYRKVLECQSSPLPRQVGGSIKRVLCLSPFAPCHYRQFEASWDSISADTYTDAETYQYIGPKHMAERILTFDERLEWERLRWSAAQQTPREFKKGLAQTRLPLRVPWVVHNGRRCSDKTIRID